MNKMNETKVLSNQWKNFLDIAFFESVDAIQKASTRQEFYLTQMKHKIFFHEIKFATEWNF